MNCRGRRSLLDGASRRLMPDTHIVGRMRAVRRHWGGAGARLLQQVVSRYSTAGRSAKTKGEIFVVVTVLI